MKPNAWTVGNKVSYDTALAEREMQGQPVRKVGRTEDYEGGCVFRNKEAAQAFIDANDFPYDVYGLILPGPWDEVVDSSKEAEVGYSLLLKDAIIAWKS